MARAMPAGRELSCNRGAMLHPSTKPLSNLGIVEVSERRPLPWHEGGYSSPHTKLHTHSLTYTTRPWRKPGDGWWARDLRLGWRRATRCRFAHQVKNRRSPQKPDWTRIPPLSGRIGPLWRDADRPGLILRSHQGLGITGSRLISLG